MGLFTSARLHRKKHVFIDYLQFILPYRNTFHVEARVFSLAAREEFVIVTAQLEALLHTPVKEKAKIIDAVKRA